MILFLCAALSGRAQTNVPRLVSFSGSVAGANGKPVTGPVAITFSLYTEEQGGSPLWSEIQTVQPDAEGHYSVFLGAASTAGLPLELFSNGTARWLAVNPGVPGVGDPARILLVGVPYALKAADADTLGGKPASAFVTTESQRPAVTTTPATAPESTPVVTPATTPTGSGTTNYVPLWTGSSTLGNSALYQVSGDIGIGTTAPVAPLTVMSSGTTAPAAVSFLTDFVGSVAGNSSGNSVYRALNMSASGTGSEPFAEITALTENSFNSLSAGIVAVQAVSSGNVRVNGAGTTTNGFGYRAVPTLTGSGGMGAWEAFDARTPSVTGGGGITNAYGIYLEPQKATGVTNGYGVYQAGASDTNYLAGNLGIGTTTPGANLEVHGTAKFDGAVTFAGAETATGNVSTSGALISTVATGTAPLQVASTTQVANLNASLLGGQAASAFASLAGNNTFTGFNTFNSLISVTSTAKGYNAVYGNETDGTGGYFANNSTSGYPALVGSANNYTYASVGVSGYSASIYGSGVYGQLVEPSKIGNDNNAAVWGDTGGSYRIAVLGTADDGIAGYFINKSSSGHATLIGEGYGTSNPAEFYGTGGGCSIDNSGDLSCTGSKSAVVPVDNATRKVALYAVESPENWFEDFGSGQLSGGAATVTLEPVFAQTVNVGLEYHVFITPDGENKGLYVTKKTATVFEVHESYGGQSNISFDYRIVARRKGYETIRLADKTKEFDPARRPQLATANGKRAVAQAKH